MNATLAAALNPARPAAAPVRRLPTPDALRRELPLGERADR